VLLLAVTLLAIALLTRLTVLGLLLPVGRLLAVGVVGPETHDRGIGIVVGGSSPVVPVSGMMSLRIILRIRRLCGAHRVTSLRVRVWRMSGHMRVLDTVSTCLATITFFTGQDPHRPRSGGATFACSRAC